MYKPVTRHLIDRIKTLNLVLTTILFFTLYGCNGYRFIELNVSNAGELQNYLQKESNKVTDLRLTGTVGDTDTDFLIDLATSSDILTQLDFSNCDIKLPHHAFAGCTFVKSVIMPKTSMLSVPHHMFSGCTSLINVQLPENCINIEEEAFKNCSSLQQIILPNSIDIIKDGAFDGCSNLMNIYCEATIPPQCNNQSFSLIASTVNLFVPKGCSELYRKAVGWNRIKNIFELKDSSALIDTNWKNH